MTQRLFIFNLFIVYSWFYSQHTAHSILSLGATRSLARNIFRVSLVDWTAGTAGTAGPVFTPAVSEAVVTPNI